MARHVRAISSFINATYVPRIVPNHCPRVRAITSIVKGSYPVYTPLRVYVSAIPRGTAISRIPEADSLLPISQARPRRGILNAD
jgi:hypothetical protein